MRIFCLNPRMISTLSIIQDTGRDFKESLIRTVPRIFVQSWGFYFGINLVEINIMGSFVCIHRPLVKLITSILELSNLTLHLIGLLIKGRLLTCFNNLFRQVLSLALSILFFLNKIVRCGVTYLDLLEYFVDRYLFLRFVK